MATTSLQPNWSWLVESIEIAVVVLLTRGHRTDPRVVNATARGLLAVAGEGTELAAAIERASNAARAGGPAVHVRAVPVRASRVQEIGTSSEAERARVFVDVSASAADSPDGPVTVVTMVDASSRVTGEAEVARLRAQLAEVERASQRLRSLQAELVEQGERAHEMVGASAPLRRVREQVDRVAPSGLTVLIHGETGSGKELVARSIHSGSGRKGQAFVAVNCAALPESLIESELFGHEKGAFTGADRRRLGKFELADGGTLFLDEVAELPMPAQAKLLRVIQEHALERVGGAETVRVDVRILAATHRDLARQVERGRFREDLFYRLNVFKIDVPPLRERREDLRAIAEFLHARTAQRMGRPALPLSSGSLRRIMAYAWPGNVRELANAVERATLLADGTELEIELPESPLTGAMAGGGSGGDGVSGGGSASGGMAPTRDILLDLTLEQLQRLQITHALESCGYRVFGTDGAAQRLDVNPNTLLSRMDKFGIPRPRLMKKGRRG